jgi:Leucine-rich repeat (LRR) protein
MADSENGMLPQIEGKSRSASREGSRPTSGATKLPNIKARPGSNREKQIEGEGEDDGAQHSPLSPGSGEEDEGEASSPEGPNAGLQGEGKYAEESGVEDPEAEYWRRNTAVPKNSKSVAKELAKQIQSAVATKKLDIGEMELNMIPDKVFELEGLRILHAQHNRIQVLPRLIGRVKDLTQLRLFKNELRWLPAEVGECVALQVLWIQDNHLIALPGTLGNCVQLKILAVARNPLRSLPHELQKCINLKEVDFEGLDDVLSIPPVDVIKQGMAGVFMYLKEYSRRLGWVHETATLDLSSMGIKAPTLPLEVTNMTSVTALNLARNAMPALSSSINYMVSLTDLDVSDCKNLKQLSSEMGAMKQLSKIGLEGTELMSPPPEVVASGAESIVDYLATLHASRFTHTLHLSNYEVRQVDPAIGDIPGLTHLDLSNNKISSISATLSKLVDLQTLELQSNDIVLLPRALEHCTALTYVDLSDNRLEGPVFADLWVGAWCNVKHLNIKQNDRISRLPLALSNWTALQKLEIDAHQFTQPPIEVLRKGAKPTVEYCSKFADTEGTVNKLELSGYKFKAYPMEICQLKGLKALLLQYNEIRVLPEEITVLQDLRELHLSHNPLLTVPPVLEHLTGLRALRFSLPPSLPPVLPRPPSLSPSPSLPPSLPLCLCVCVFLST